jgi:hypothetical protein
MQRTSQNEAAAFRLAPLVAAIPLIPFMSVPSSPWFLGKLMDDPGHPFNWPHTGPLISALAVLFDAGILGILTVLFIVAPAYAALRHHGKNSVRNTLILCAVAGVMASQLARMTSQSFRQADLRAFANSETSPILGCLCGLAAGAFIAYFANRRIAYALSWFAPVAVLVISAVFLTWSGEVYRVH